MAAIPLDHKIKSAVAAWREKGYEGASRVTSRLLEFWFKEDHLLRDRKNPKLETKAVHAYDEPGAHKVLVKVVDIFGNDTTKMLEARVA